MPQVAGVKAITFDVFGTVVDWRGSIVREGERLGREYGVAADWAAVARRWGEKYAQGLAGPWRPLDEILREAGEELIAELRIPGLSAEDRDQWLGAWSRLDPWPDAVPGLTALRRCYRVAALSNANVALGTALARHAGLPWDVVLGPDAVRAYKPDPRVYRAALGELGLEAHEVMMSAAHLYDLGAARAEGFRTAFVRRPGEESGAPDRAEYVDLVAVDIADLAARMSA